MTNLIQHITLNDPKQAAVFVEPTPGDEDGWQRTRVFYDLDSLIANMRMRLVPLVMQARMEGDEHALKNYAGAVWMVDEIESAREILVLEASFDLPSSDE